MILAARKTNMSSFNKICSVEIRGKRRKVLSHHEFLTCSVVAACHFVSEYLAFYLENNILHTVLALRFLRTSFLTIILEHSVDPEGPV